jgi:hypothetical protein
MKQRGRQQMIVTDLYVFWTFDWDLCSPPVHRQEPFSCLCAVEFAEPNTTMIHGNIWIDRLYFKSANEGLNLLEFH